MSLVEALGRAAEGDRGPNPLERLIAGLGKEERDALVLALSNQRLSAYRIAQILETNGHRISDDTIRKYRDPYLVDA